MKTNTERAFVYSSKINGEKTINKGVVYATNRKDARHMATKTTRLSSESDSDKITITFH
jgi:hypothetical protein